MTQDKGKNRTHFGDKYTLFYNRLQPLTKLGLQGLKYTRTPTYVERVLFVLGSTGSLLSPDLGRKNNFVLKLTFQMSNLQTCSTCLQSVSPISMSSSNRWLNPAETAALAQQLSPDRAWPTKCDLATVIDTPHASVWSSQPIKNPKRVIDRLVEQKCC